jgi:hypothetical protein
MAIQLEFVCLGLLPVTAVPRASKGLAIIKELGTSGMVLFDEAGLTPLPLREPIETLVNLLVCSLAPYQF